MKDKSKNWNNNKLLIPLWLYSPGSSANTGGGVGKIFFQRIVCTHNAILLQYHKSEILRLSTHSVCLTFGQSAPLIDHFPLIGPPILPYCLVHASFLGCFLIQYSNFSKLLQTMKVKYIKILTKILWLKLINE